MRFEVEDKTFSLSFERFIPDGKKHLRTTAILYQKVDEKWVVHDSATVTRHPGDKLTKEAGRQWALRKLAGNLRGNGNNIIAGAMLGSYFNRPHPKDPAGLLKQITMLANEYRNVTGLTTKVVVA